MKTYSLLLFVALIFAISSCDKDDEMIRLGNPPAPNVLTNEATDATVVLEQENSDEIFAILNWTASDFGGKPVKYSIEIDKAGNEFANARDIATVGVLKDTLTIAEINQSLILYGIEPGETVDMEIRIRSWVDYISAPGVSNVLQFTLTPYLLVFPPVFIVGDAQGWNLANAVELVSTTPGIHTGKARFQANGKFRFFGAPDWAAEQWGWSTFSGGAVPETLTDGGDGDSNFLFGGVTADYFITVSIPDKTITLELAGPAPAPASLFLVTAQTYDLSAVQVLPGIDSAVYEQVVMLEANTKFRIFEAASWNAGKWVAGSFETMDALLQSSGDDVSNLLFTGTPGYYILKVSLIDKSISLVPTTAPAEVLYLIGDPQEWALNNTLAMRSLGGNTFEVTAAFEPGDIFKFFTALDWNSDPYVWGSFEGGTVDSDLAEGSDSNFEFVATAGVYKVTVSLPDKTIAVEPADTPTLFIMGADQGWLAANAVSLTWLGGGTFQGTTTFTNGAMFRFFANNDPGAWDWNGEQWYYSNFVDGEIDTDNLEEGNDSNFVFVGTTGSHTINVNIHSLTVGIE